MKIGYVEQKSHHMVLQATGYARYEAVEEVALPARPHEKAVHRSMGGRWKVKKTDR
jgi:hypothetical protein